MLLFIHLKLITFFTQHSMINNGASIDIKDIEDIKDMDRPTENSTTDKGLKD